VGPTLQLLLVTGSNMSGKSTLLRTVGINTVLALAGAPVCAGGLQLTPLAIATAMRNVDSLQEGVSAFYAEIQRLRVICDRAATPPTLLFLLDEILHGTNSHDRRIGAEAVIESLLGQGALGLVTTHDLALAEIADRRPEQAANVHFEDQLEDAKIRFDYQLRQGVVPKGNGLVLMRLLGFDT
jgi:DNA mismatch repair ATPase MutS